MPSSYYENIPPILDILSKLRFTKVLDVGIGYGKYGSLIREYFDNWLGGTTIDGVEIHRPYIEMVYPRIYSDIYIGDFLEMPAERHYHVCLLIDVIEHWTKEDAWKAIKKARGLADHVIVSTPQGFLEQGAVGGNQYETHLSGWEADELPGDDYSNELSIIKLIKGEA